MELRGWIMQITPHKYAIMKELKSLYAKFREDLSRDREEKGRKDSYGYDGDDFKGEECMMRGGS